MAGKGARVKVADKLPLRRAGIQQEALDDSLVLFDSSQNMVHILNRTAAAIWIMCDGKENLAEITNKTAQMFGCRPAMIRKHISAIIRQFSEAGLIVLNEATKTEAPHQTP